MRNRTRFSVTCKVVLFAVALFGICSIASTTHAAKPAAGPTSEVEIIPNGSTYGYGEWSAKWWQWALSIPLVNPDTGLLQHPLFVDGNVDCSVGQSGNVWFLGGRFCETGQSCPQPGTVVRFCTIPQGKALFIPIVNGEDSLVEEKEAFQATPTLDAMRAGLASMMETVTDLQLVVDGVPVQNLEKFRTISPIFNFTLPQPYYGVGDNQQPDNVFTAIEPGNYPAGVYRHQAVTDGYYVMLKPLPVGQHLITFSGAIPTPSGPFIISMTYSITVQ